MGSWVGWSAEVKSHQIITEKSNGKGAKVGSIKSCGDEETGKEKIRETYIRKRRGSSSKIIVVHGGVQSDRRRK